MLTFFKDKLFTAKWIRNYLMILSGSIIMALAYALFIIPFNIVPGGVYGLAIIFHRFFDFPVGLTGLILNIPLFIWGIRVLGPRFGVKTLLGLLLTSGFIDLFSWLRGPAMVTDDLLMASIYGGVLTGIGLGLIFRAKATSGGSDIVAQIISRALKSPIGVTLILVDALVVGAGMLAFQDIGMGLYAVIIIFVTGKVIDTILEGLSYHKVVFIVSKKTEEIREMIIHGLGRGGTVLKAGGLYEGEPREVIFSALNRREVVTLKELVRRADPEAFITVFNASEVLGEGFKPLEEM